MFKPEKYFKRDKSGNFIIPESEYENFELLSVVAKRNNWSARKTYNLGYAGKIFIAKLDGRAKVYMPSIVDYRESELKKAAKKLTNIARRRDLLS